MANPMADKVIITRHPALIEYLKEINLISGTEPVITGNATVPDVSGKHVIGILPNYLAVFAEAVTEVPLNTPYELRGHELTLAQVRQYAAEPVTYRIRFAQMEEPYHCPTCANALGELCFSS